MWQTPSLNPIVTCYANPRPCLGHGKPYFLRDLFKEIIISTPRTVGFGSYAGPRALDPEPSCPQSSLEGGSGGGGGRALQSPPPFQPDQLLQSELSLPSLPLASSSHSHVYLLLIKELQTRSLGQILAHQLTS